MKLTKKQSRHNERSSEILKLSREIRNELGLPFSTENAKRCIELANAAYDAGRRPVAK